MDIQRRLEVVEHENGVLRERIRVLEAALVGEFHAPFEWGLTTKERTVLGVLVMRELATKSAIMAALYHDLGKDEAEEKIVDVFVCKIRKKVKSFGVDIETVWGQGYRLSPEWRARLKAIGAAASDEQEAVAA